MFGISILELFVIIVIGLIFLSPKDVIKVLSMIITGLSSIKALLNKMTNEVQKIDVLSSFEDYIIVNKEIKSEDIKIKNTKEENIKQNDK